MMNTAIYLILLFLLLILSAFFSGTETAVMSINRYRLKHRAQKGDKKAQNILNMTKSPEKFLALVLIGNNLVNISASSIATILSLKYFGDYAVAIATFGLTFVVLIFCEITPKTIAALKPELVANKASFTINLLMTIGQPVIYVMNLITKLIISIFGIKKKKTAAAAVQRRNATAVLENMGCKASESIHTSPEPDLSAAAIPSVF